MAEITRAELVRQLHADGKGRNEIARILRCSPATVSKAAREAGVTFDRTATAAATEARQIDGEALRSEVAHTFLLKSAEFLAAAVPDADDPRAGVANMQAAGIAIGRHMQMEKHEVDLAAEREKAGRGDLSQFVLWIDNVVAPRGDEDQDYDQEVDQ